MHRRLPIVAALLVLSACVRAEVLSLAFDQGAAVTFEAGTSHNLSVTMVATDPTPLEVAWDAGCGEIMGAIRRATYVAPDAPGTCEVTATSLFDPTKVARLTVTVVAAAGGGKVEWTRQFGSANHDWIRRVAAGADGRTYVVGETQGDLDGAISGESDLFLRAFEADGTLAWARHLGSASQDFVNGVAVDGAGAVYVAGTVGMDIEGGATTYDQDAFVRKYDDAGNPLWTREFGTEATDTAQGIRVDSDGRVWVSGWTQGALAGGNAGGPDAFVRTFDGDGNELWTRQFGSDGFEYALAVAPDGAGGAVLVGNTTGRVGETAGGGIDWFVKRYDAEGRVTWTTQFGAATDDRAYGAASLPGGGVVVTGANGLDGFVTTFAVDGTVGWTATLATDGEDLGQDVATGPNGDVVVVGMTSGALEGENLGFFDAFVRRYDAAGNPLWTRQFGTGADDYGWGVAVSEDGHVTFGGRTDGVFADRWFGGADAFLRRLGP